MNYNDFIWKGYKYMCGAIDVESGKVMECHTYNQMKEADFHSDFAFTYEQGSAINLGKSVMFCVEDGDILLDDGTLVFEECGLESKREFLLENIAKQIRVLA